MRLPTCLCSDSSGTTLVLWCIFITSAYSSHSRTPTAVPATNRPQHTLKASGWQPESGLAQLLRIEWSSGKASIFSSCWQQQAFSLCCGLLGAGTALAVIPLYLWYFVTVMYPFWVRNNSVNRKRGSFYIIKNKILSSSIAILIFSPNPTYVPIFS